MVDVGLVCPLTKPYPKTVLPEMQVRCQDENFKKDALKGRERAGEGRDGPAFARGYGGQARIRDYSPPQDGFAGANLIQSLSQIKRASRHVPVISILDQ
jgi:hypothetical protein